MIVWVQPALPDRTRDMLEGFLNQKLFSNTVGLKGMAGSSDWEIASKRGAILVTLNSLSPKNLGNISLKSTLGLVHWLLISLEYLKKWGVLHETFPRENLDDYISRKYLNKNTCYYTDVSNLNRNLYEVDRKTREPSELCKKKREEILNKWPDCFKETLEKGDRIKHPPIKIKLKSPLSLQSPLRFALSRIGCTIKYMCVSPLKFDTSKVGWLKFITRSSRIEWQAIPQRRKGQSLPV